MTYHAGSKTRTTRRSEDFGLMVSCLTPSPTRRVARMLKARPGLVSAGETSGRIASLSLCLGRCSIVLNRLSRLADFHSTRHSSHYGLRLYMTVKSPNRSQPPLPLRFNLHGPRSSDIPLEERPMHHRNTLRHCNFQRVWQCAGHFAASVLCTILSHSPGNRALYGDCCCFLFYRE